MKRVILLVGLVVVLGLSLVRAQSTVMPVGIYEEYDYRFTYTGTWIRPAGNCLFAGYTYLGGSAAYTATTGDKVSFTVDKGVGRVILYRVAYVTYSPIQVYENGVLDETLTQGYAGSTGLCNQAVTFHVEPGATIELRNGGGCCFVFERLELLPPSAALVQVITATPTPTLTPTSGPSPTPTVTPTATPDYVQNVQVTLSAGGRNVAVRYEVRPAEVATVAILFVIAGTCFLVALIYIRRQPR